MPSRIPLFINEMQDQLDLRVTAQEVPALANHIDFEQPSQLTLPFDHSTVILSNHILVIVR